MGKIISLKDACNAPSITPEKTFESCAYKVSAGDGKNPANPGSKDFQLCCSCPVDEILKKYEKVEIFDENSKLKVKLPLLASFNLPELSMGYALKVTNLTEKTCGKCRYHTLSQEFIYRYPAPPTSRVDPTPINPIHDVLSNPLP